MIGTLDHYGFLKEINIPLSLSAFVGTTLSLLLAFRTSQSYERWWEARVVWGAIVNDSRTLIRQVKQFLPAKPDSDAHVESFADRQIIWCFTLSESSRRVPFSKKVNDYFQNNGINSDKRPNSLLNKHADELALISTQYDLDANKQVQIDATVTLPFFEPV
ncbi:hypothetical protein H7F33_08705 [Pedobacter sp. PAMC26386]|nr:hypothetical protein H7F33_08705 [Pedobacter sp. PAMC26386]